MSEPCDHLLGYRMADDGEEYRASERAWLIQVWRADLARWQKQYLESGGSWHHKESDPVYQRTLNLSDDELLEEKYGPLFKYCPDCGEKL